MILTDKMIQEAQACGAIKIEPFDENQIQPASYDLRIGPEAALASQHKKIDVEKAGFVEIDAGDFAILSTHEIITLDAQHVARFDLRSKWERKWLSATFGPQIDPGFKGRLTIGVTNLTSKKTVLSHLDDFVTLEVHKLSAPVENAYSGPYQEQLSLSSEDVEAVLEREVMSLSDMNKTLRELSISMKDINKHINDINKRIDHNNSSMRWVIGAGFSVLALLIALLPLLITID